MATSSTPETSPIAAVPRTSAPKDSAKPGAAIATLTASPPAVSSGALPRRAASAPASGWETSIVSVSASSAKPIRPLPSSSRSWIAGSRANNDAATKPLRAKKLGDGGARAHGRDALVSMVAAFPGG